MANSGEAAIAAMKDRITELGSQIRAIKQGGGASTSAAANGAGDFDSIKAELTELKAKLAKAEKEHKEEKERNKITLKVPKVRCHLSNGSISPGYPCEDRAQG